MRAAAGFISPPHALGTRFSPTRHYFSGLTNDILWHRCLVGFSETIAPLTLGSYYLLFCSPGIIMIADVKLLAGLVIGTLVL